VGTEYRDVHEKVCSGNARERQPTSDLEQPGIAFGWIILPQFSHILCKSPFQALLMMQQRQLLEVT
jgi:hypothetical protein